MDNTDAAFRGDIRMNARVGHVQFTPVGCEAVSVCYPPGACMAVATLQDNPQRLKHEWGSAMRGAKNPMTAFSR